MSEQNQNPNPNEQEPTNLGGQPGAEGGNPGEQAGGEEKPFQITKEQWEANQKALAESQKFIGRQSAEIGTLRNTINDFQAKNEPQLDVESNYTDEELDDMMVDNPKKYREIMRNTVKADLQKDHQAQAESIKQAESVQAQRDLVDKLGKDYGLELYPGSDDWNKMNEAFKTLNIHGAVNEIAFESAFRAAFPKRAAERDYHAVKDRSEAAPDPSVTTGGGDATTGGKIPGFDYSKAGDEAYLFHVRRTNPQMYKQYLAEIGV